MPSCAERESDTRSGSEGALLETYWRTRDPGLHEPILKQFQHLIHSLAHKFARGGVLREDLVQVASLGLMRALDRFDTDRGVRFATYAVANMVGEIKHHFRDHSWAIKVPRRLQEIAARLPRVEEEIYRRLGRSPTILELAQQLGTTEEDLLEAMALGNTYQAQSLDTRFEFETVGGIDGRHDQTGAADVRLEAVVEYAPLMAALANLNERQRRIVSLRHLEGWSQRDVGRVLGISQMHVSRLERQALAALRDATRAEYSAPQL
jgi:RNA polymerase sigma-B factor